jgi:hypothetical protein
LIKRFLPGWNKARVKFVPAGETFEGKPVDSDGEVLHCDTGSGRFDHHQTDSFTCAANLVAREIFKVNEKVDDLKKKAIERMVVVINEDDHAHFLAWPEPASDRWDFGLSRALGGVVSNFKNCPEKIIEYFLVVLDGTFRIFLEKIEAEEMLETGLKFKTNWGRGIAVSSGNSEFPRLALKLGYAVVVRKRPKSSHLGIYGHWQKGVNFKKVFQKLKKKDPEASWYFHPDGCMILNKSINHPGRKPTRLSLEDVVEIVKAKS